MSEPGARYVPPLLARKRLAGNPYFSLFADQVEPKPGADPYTYYFMDCVNEAALVLPVLDDGRLVLERIYRHPYGDYLLEFPAGGIAIGEDPAHAAARELSEETGYRAATLEKLGVAEPLPGLVRMPLHIFRATDLSLGEPDEPEPLELLETVLLTPDEAWAEAEAGRCSGFFALGMAYLSRTDLG
ncbi:MAG: NUDIX hydrolase [Planctomycetota bacterium]|jgi:ADP-ribose pyrophosphatase|nr:NUDIX hydrolase [Planctomycetota bacterium]